MKTNKKLIIAGSILLLAVFVIGTGFLVHEGPPGFCRGGFHQRFHGRDFSKHILKRMDSKVEKLNLTDLQQEKYQEIRGRIEADLSEMKNNRREFFTEFKEEMNSETPNVEKIVALMKGKLEQMPVKIGAHLDYFVELYSILDEEQKAQVIERFREKMNRFHPGHLSSDADTELEDQ